MQYETKINTSRAGLETRNRRRLEPVIQIEYWLSGLTNDEYQARVEQIDDDARAALWVPMWTDYDTLAQDMTGPNHTNLELSNAKRAGFFNAGDYVYLQSGTTTKEFRSIASVTDTTNMVLDVLGGSSQFDSGDVVYPCLACEQLPTGIELTRNAPESRELKLVFRSTGIPVAATSYATVIPTEGHSTENTEGGA